MISRRNYFVVAALMMIILILFQFSEVAKTAGNNYATNENLDITYPANMQYQGTFLKAGNSNIIVDWKDGDYILFVGDRSTNIGSIVSQWTEYTKRNLLECNKLSDFDVKAYKQPEFVIVDSKAVDFDKDLESLLAMSDAGMSIVFCSLPSAEVISQSDDLKKLFGIAYVKEKTVEVEGIKLFSGFLFGGETIYKPEKKSDERRQDMELNVPWYVTSGATKTYMVGMLDDYYEDFEDKNDYFPALIWRNSVSEKSQIFCVAGDYMETTAGIGILASIIYELSDYSIYPVVNAQNTLLISYPLMANENDAKLQSIYSRSYDAFQSIVIWSSLISSLEKYGLKYTAFLSPKYNYSDNVEPEYDTYVSYLTDFSETGTEVGYSLVHDSSINMVGKVKKDAEYFNKLENRYLSTSAFVDLDEKDELNDALSSTFTKTIRTIACDEDVSIPILSYLSDDVTLQCLTSNAENFTYSRDLMLKSVETALGYDNAKLDFTQVAWPQSDSDHWENIYDDMSSSLATFWNPFRVFDRTTLSESDQRVRTFLNIKYSTERTKDVVKLTVSDRDNQTCYFVLRTHGYDIESVSENVSYEKIEDYAYLLKIDCDELTVNLKNALNVNR